MHSHANTARKNAHQQAIFKLNPIAAACAAAFLLASTNSYAQQADATATTEEQEIAAKKKKDGEAVELDAVKVTGIRGSIANSIEKKREATSIVETISAEDIGKLPDSSIAESIARLPGLTAQRERGRAAQVNIRGLSGDFAGTTLNGREQTTTSDNRGVEFDQYPSELLSGVTVYKTPDASLMGQGISGTVDLETLKPLSYGDRVVAMNFRFDQNENNSQKQYGKRFSFSYIDQFLDNTVGFAIGYAHLDSPTSGFQNEAWGYPSERWNGMANVPAVPGNPGVSIFGGGKLYKFDNSNKRDGLFTTLQFKPNEFYEGKIDLFYSKFKKTEVKTGLEFGTVFGPSGPSQIPVTFVINGNTVVDSTWTGVRPVVRMDSNPSEDALFSIGWNNKFIINDNWSVVADISHSNTRHKFRVLETYAGLTGTGTSDLRIQLDPSGSFNNFTFARDLNNPSNLRLIDAGGWGQDGYIKDFDVTDKLSAFRVDAKRSFDQGIISSMEFGVNVSDRKKEKSSIEAKLCLVACAGGDTAAFPGTAGTFGFGGVGGLAFYDANALFGSGIYNLVGNFNNNIANKNWSVSETVSTFYTQLNIDTDIGEMPLRGNVGFQYVNVDQSSSGFSTFAGNPAGTPTEAGTTYGDFLPSLNLSLGLPADQYLRFSAARQVQRPRLDDMRASFDVSVSAGGCAGQPGPIFCGGGGNPELKPWLANAYDLSYEKYFTTEAGNKGYISAAYFYKELQSYIYRRDVQYDYAGSPFPAIAPGQIVGVTYPGTSVGVINQPINGEGGVLKGLELAVSVPFDLLWSPLQGFGVQASYSDTRSSISPNGPGTSDPLPGLSKYVSNITAYYERAGFSIRFSQRTRSAFRGETRGFGADLSYINIDGETVQDAQVNYNFGSGTLEGLSLYLQVSNIGDTPFTTSDSGNPSLRPVQYFEYGRTTLLGFSYKF